MLYEVITDESHPVEEIAAGDIAAIVGENGLATGDTLCDERDPVVLEAMTLPLPVVAVAVEPRAEEDRERLEEGLRRLVAEDPSLRWKSDPFTGQMVVSGMGELHLEVVMERLRKASRIDPRVGRPTVRNNFV